MAPYRVLVVDDSPFMRKIFSDLIVKDPQFTIVATASNGVEAIEAVSKWKPDAITLDLEMPEMNGIEALQHIMKQNPTPIIMLSGISEDNTRETIKALQYGAFDFIRKPSSAFSNDIIQVGELLIEKLKIAVLTKRYTPVSELDEPVKPIKSKPAIDNVPKSQPAQQQLSNTTRSPDRKHKQQGEHTPAPALNKATSADELNAQSQSKNQLREPIEKYASPLHSKRKAQTPAFVEPQEKEKVQSKPAPKSGTFRHIIAIGTSTGGPRALHEVICSLPEGFAAPVLVVQHMPPKFTKSLAQRLDSFSSLNVIEASQGERIQAGFVYIAPGGYHMEMAKDHSGYYIQLTQQPPRNGHRPSVDVLFESFIPFKELKRHAVVMTGMGSDGAKGLKLLVESGAETAIAEAEETCVVYGMPRTAVEGGSVTAVLPLQSIAAKLQTVITN